MAATAEGVTRRTYHHQDGTDEKRCRSCHSTALRVDWKAGDRVCTECGVVDEDRLLDQRPEWREFEDDAPSAPVRCGLVPVNEQKWVGGLQPTTLSKYSYGAATAHSSKMRKTLVQCHYIMERNFEKRHAREVREARWMIKARQRRLREQARTQGSDQRNPQELSELDKFILEEEQDSLARTAALYAEKWSLARCLLLFGTPQEQSSSVPSDHTEPVEDLRQNLDETLIGASRELYRAYTLLMRTGRNLQLPERILNDAAQSLSAFASRRDGLSVKGLASQLKRNQSKQVSAEAHQQARAALREYNSVRQCSALAAALLFCTARSKGHFRPLSDVCGAVPSDVISSQIHREWTKGEPLLKMKHCSRAMAELKQTLPDLAKNPTPGENGKGQDQLSKSESSLMLDNLSTENYILHATRCLQLPPVAAACLQILVKRAPSSEKLPLRTASFTYFLALVGQTMQKLAAQASSRKRPRYTKNLYTPRGIIEAEDRAGSTGSSDAKIEETSNSIDGMLTNIAAEEKAYQMQRMWNAWKDQTSWWRSLPEISKAIHVPAHLIRDYYKRNIYPQRRVLLQNLSQADSESAPLSSVLLPNIALAAPLMKDD